MIFFTDFFDINGLFGEGRDELSELENLIEQIISFSEKARREGLLALEDDLEEIPCEYLKKLIQLIVDGTDPELVNNIALTEMNQTLDRLKEIHECVAFALLENASADFDKRYKLLCKSKNLSWYSDEITRIASEINSAISSPDNHPLGQVTPRYRDIIEAAGSDLQKEEKARIIQNHLKSSQKYNLSAYSIMLHGTLGIQSGDNPRIIKDKIIAYLDPVTKKSLSAKLDKW